MENLNPPPLNLVFSTRAASQEITVPSDFSGGILIELILGNKINGYVKRVMLRIKIN